MITLNFDNLKPHYLLFTLVFDNALEHGTGSDAKDE